METKPSNKNFCKQFVNRENDYKVECQLFSLQLATVYEPQDIETDSERDAYVYTVLYGCL